MNKDSNIPDMQTIAPQTIRFIQQAMLLLDDMGTKNRTLRNYFYHRRWPTEGSRYLSLEECANLVLELESRVRKQDLQIGEHSIVETGVNNRYPIFHDSLDVAPIYGDALVLECHRPLVLPSQIPCLLYLLNIPGFKEGVHLDNHNFGFHFHYGKVKSNTVLRTNLLLTFDPAENISTAPGGEHFGSRPLYGERHAEGKCKKIEFETIGVNKRRPIYLVCLEVGGKRGFANFKRPSKKSIVFHDGI